MLEMNVSAMIQKKKHKCLTIAGHYFVHRHDAEQNIEHSKY